MPDLYWLAGLIEGEGCYALHKRNGKIDFISLTIRMCDRDIIERAASLLKAPIHIIKPSSSIKPQYGLMLTGRKAAMWMMTLYSLMGKRRKEKIKECLTWWKQFRPNRGRLIGSKFVAGKRIALREIK